ncbi:MAG: hypothetical protein ACRDBG_05535 [Waterburya sp.]
MTNIKQAEGGYSLQVIQIDNEDYAIRLIFSNPSEKLPYGGWLPYYEYVLELDKGFLYLLDLDMDSDTQAGEESPKILGKEMLKGSLSRMNEMAIFMDDCWL